MRKIWLLSLLIILSSFTQSYAETRTWGGTKLRVADSIYGSFLRGSFPDSNYGALVSWNAGNGSPATSENQNIVIRMVNDPSLPGYTQGVCTLFIYVDAGGNPGTFKAYVLKTPWGEGTKQGQTATAGECSWNDALQGTAAWQSPGAQGANDRGATVVASYTVSAGYSAGYIPLAIDGSYLTSDFFNYGLVIVYTAASTFQSITVGSDDRGVATQRPYFSGRQYSSREATIGYPHIGGTEQTNRGQDGTANSGNTTSGVNYVARGNDVIDSIYVYAKSTSGSTESLWVALYELNYVIASPKRPRYRSYGAINSLYSAVALIDNVSTSAGWYSLDVNWPLQKGWTYVLAVGDTGVATTDNVSLYYNAAGGSDAETIASTMATLWNGGSPGTSESRLYSLYGVIDTASQQGMVGDSSYADANAEAPSTEATYWQTLESKTYTAGPSEVITDVAVWIETVDTAAVGLYEFDVVGDTPGVLVYFDTLFFPQRASENIWRRKAVRWPLTEGTTYSFAVANIDGATNSLFKGSSSAGFADSSSRYKSKSAVMLPDPFTSSGITNNARSINGFARVEYQPADSFFIGYKEIDRATSNGASWGTNIGFVHRNPADWYVAQDGDVVTEIHWYGAGYCLPNMELEAAIYDVINDTAKNLVYLDTIILGTSGTYGVYSVTGLNVPLTAGKTYTVGWCNDDGCGIGISAKYNPDIQYGTLYTTSDLTDPYTVNGTNNERFAMWAVGVNQVSGGKRNIIKGNILKGRMLGDIREGPNKYTKMCEVFP